MSEAVTQTKKVEEAKVPADSIIKGLPKNEAPKQPEVNKTSEQIQQEAINKAFQAGYNKALDELAKKDQPHIAIMR